MSEFIYGFIYGFILTILALFRSTPPMFYLTQAITTGIVTGFFMNVLSHLHSDYILKGSPEQGLSMYLTLAVLLFMSHSFAQHVLHTCSSIMISLA